MQNSNQLGWIDRDNWVIHLFFSSKILDSKLVNKDNRHHEKFTP